MKKNKKMSTDLWQVIGVWVSIFTFIIFFIDFRSNRKSLSRQQFESNFFALLTNHNQIADNLYYENRTVGREAFSIYRDQISGNIFYDSEMSLDDMRSQYAKVFPGLRLLIESYSKSLHLIINYIDSSKDLTDKDKRFYLSMLTSQMSAFEKIAVFYHMIFGDPQLAYINGLVRLEKKYGILLDVDIAWLCRNFDDYMLFKEAGIHDIKPGEPLKTGEF